MKPARHSFYVPSDSAQERLVASTPSSLPANRLNQASAQQLREVAGNPHATESEWLDAVNRLGPAPPPTIKRRSKSVVPIVTAVSIALAMLGVSAFWICSVIAPFAHVPAVLAPRPSSAEVDYRPYMAQLQRSIKRNWFPPNIAQSDRVVVQFKVHKDGSVDNLELLTSSGSQASDQAALNAVRNAHVQPLPAGAGADVDIQFTFDYAVLGPAGLR